MNFIAVLISVTLGLRLLDGFYYHDAEPVLRLLRLIPRDHEKPIGHGRRRLDELFCWFPFIWVWCDILIAVRLGYLANVLPGWLFVTVLVGGRMRALQEAAHTAVHSGLCRPRNYQWAIANIFAQWPLGRPDMHHRHIGHVHNHHKHPNELDNDPNVRRFVTLGIVPGISRARWRWVLFHSFTPIGLRETMWNIIDGTFRKNIRPIFVPLRLSVTAAFLGILWTAGSYIGLIFGFVLPMLTTYPFFSWISVLVEHRWFVSCNAANHREREYINGRPTDYPGLTGWLISSLMFPFSDRYHLAHSLYPSVRWNYLPALDHALKAQDCCYPRNRSVGLVYSKDGQPSALSELRDRLTTPDCPDVAAWARGLGPRSNQRLPDPISV